MAGRAWFLKSEPGLASLILNKPSPDTVVGLKFK
ncbi:Uncharacterised protein [Chlamydia trachomatis]|nr:Uncharacterised protein [Chlamydia trachomatis]